MSKDLFGNEIVIEEVEEVKEKKVSPFDLAHDLTSKERYDSEASEMKSYTKFLLNRTLSYHPDILDFANKMNFRPDLDDKLTEMANEAIQESSQKSVPQTRTQTAPRQRVVKEEPAVEEKKVEPVKKTQPKPVRRKTNTKVEDDFPY